MSQHLIIHEIFLSKKASSSVAVDISEHKNFLLDGDFFRRFWFFSNLVISSQYALRSQ